MPCAVWVICISAVSRGILDTLGIVGRPVDFTNILYGIRVAVYTVIARQL